MYILLLCGSIYAFSQSYEKKNNQISGLNARQFHKYWKVESESPDYKVTFRGDTAEIVSPKGLTLWRKEKMSGKVTIEYDACVVSETGKDRLSDLNCFWMASDPKHPDNLWKREKWRNGIFLNCYSLQLYYLGYGGNHNSTTRFRRYDGNEAGITDPQARPAVLKEYTDAEHLLKANHWYHIKITNENNRVSYYIDGKRLVDFRDAKPLTEGWFGFRTTLSRTRITNFRYECSLQETSTVPLQWIGSTPEMDKAVSFGVPFEKGKISPESTLQLTTVNGENIPIDTWVLAYWPDGSVKWSGVAGVIPAGTEGATLELAKKKSVKKARTTNPDDQASVSVTETPRNILIETGVISVYIPRQGEFLIDSLLYKGVKVGEKARLICSTQSTPVLESTSQVSFSNYVSEVKSATVERCGAIRTLIKLEGVHKNKDGREWLPFVVRLYFYGGSEQMKMVHSFLFDGDQNQDFIRALGIRFDVPMREALYNRHIAFSCADGGVWSEPVQPLVGRRVLTLGDAANRNSGRDVTDKNASKDKKVSLQQQQMEGKRIPPYETFDCALARIAWSGNAEGWDAYYEELKGKHYDRMAAMGIRFRLFPPKVGYGDGAFTASADDGSAIYYLMDGSPEEHPYTAPVRTGKPHLYRFYSRYGTARSPYVADKSRWRTITPAVAITTSMGESAKFPYANAESYKGLSRTRRACRQQDWIRYTFSEPVRCREMYLQTGNRQLPKTIVTTGYAEVSYDGATFERAGELEMGSITLRPGRPVKAVRIVSTCDDNGTPYVTIQPPQVKPAL